MGLAERLVMYRSLEGLRKRSLIVYVTSWRPGAQASMAPDAIPALLDHLTSISNDVNAIDLLVASYGGDPTVAWRIMSLLRERFTHVAVLIPQAAFSAATLLAMGADEIVMHPHGNLGPVDPQITVRRKDAGTNQEGDFRFGYEDLEVFLSFVNDRIGALRPEQLGELLKLLCQEVGVVPLGVASRGAKLASSMGENLLRMHMKGEDDADRARIIVEKLNKNFFHHGYPVSRSEAKNEIGLKVAEPNPKVEDLIWNIWLDIEAELRIREPFHPVVELFADAGASERLMEPPLLAKLPVGMSPELLKSAYQKVLSQIECAPVPLVEYSQIRVVMESSRLARRYITEGKIAGQRMPDLEVKASMYPTFQGWRQIDLPAE